MNDVTYSTDGIAGSAVAPRRRRSGTEIRRRNRLQVGVRLDVVEHEAITTLADQAGMTLADYLRWAAIGKRARFRRSRESGDAARLRLLKELLGHVGRVGTNINQMARQANVAALAGQSEMETLRELQATIMAWKAELREILGVRGIGA